MNYYLGTSVQSVLQRFPLKLTPTARIEIIKLILQMRKQTPFSDSRCHKTRTVAKHGFSTTPASLTRRLLLMTSPPTDDITSEHPPHLVLSHFVLSRAEAICLAQKQLTYIRNINRRFLNMQHVKF